MPKLGEYRYILDNVAFIYGSPEEAACGQKAGGTGFFVAVPSTKLPESFHHIYIVTNYHVARDQPRTLRIRARQGSIDFITITKWFTVPGGPDVAVAPVTLNPERHVVEALRSDSWLLTKSEAAEQEIDVGDDVFMVGRFIDHDGGQTNQPSARFGHISMTDAAIRQVTDCDRGSYVIDMHSRSGYSGSPVFVYRTAGSVFSKPNTLMGGGHLMKLLGIHWGQFPERWDLVSAEVQEAAEAGLITDGQYVSGLSGMTCVVPSWDILDVLNCPQLVEMRALVEDRCVS